MQVTRWNRRSLAISAMCVVVSYWIFSASHNTYEDQTIIDQTPNRLNFKVINDEGNLDHWRYSATYTERLSHWPHWLNEATADFEVKKLHGHDRGHYSVESRHRTCFLWGLYCLYSTGQFYFAKAGSDTKCTEVVQYECPPFFGPMCRSEVSYQRNAIMRNLRAHFGSRNKSA